MEDVKNFLIKFRGAIIGFLIGILVLIFRFHFVIIGAFVLVLCMLAGNYVQNNKEKVKEKLKYYIDKF